MELSGHSPFIVFEDADLIKYQIWLFMQNLEIMDKYVSPSRFYIHENKKEAFTKLMIDKTKI